MQAEFLAFNNGDPWGGMADQVLPGIGGLAGHLRDHQQLARERERRRERVDPRRSSRWVAAGLLPRAFAAVHPTYRTPVNAVHLQGILGIALAVGLGLLFQGRAPRAAR